MGTAITVPVIDSWPSLFSLIASCLLPPSTPADPTPPNPHLTTISASALPLLLPQHCPARVLQYHSTYTTHLPTPLRYLRTPQHHTLATMTPLTLYDPVQTIHHHHFTLCFSSSSCAGAENFQSPAASNLPISASEILMLRRRQIIWRQWGDQETLVELPIISGYSTPISLYRKPLCLLLVFLFLIDGIIQNHVVKITSTLITMVDTPSVTKNQNLDTVFVFTASLILLAEDFSPRMCQQRALPIPRCSIEFH